MLSTSLLSKQVAIEFGVMVDKGKYCPCFLVSQGFLGIKLRSAMMESIKIHQRVGQDGILHLDIPVGLRDRDVEVMVIYRPLHSLTTVELSLEALYGICADDPINVDDRGISEALDDELAGAFD